MYVCIHIYIYIYIYVLYTYIHMHIYAHKYIHTCIHIYTDYTHTHIYICTYTLYHKYASLWPPGRLRPGGPAAPRVDEILRVDSWPGKFGVADIELN